MLKYLGDLLETVMMPKIVVGELNKFATGSRCWRGWACKPCPPRGANAEQKLDDAGQTAVKLLKGNGLSEVVAQFTHIGMVVYQAPEYAIPAGPKEYQYLVGISARQTSTRCSTSTARSSKSFSAKRKITPSRSVPRTPPLTPGTYKFAGK